MKGMDEEVAARFGVPGPDPGSGSAGDGPRPPSPAPLGPANRKPRIPKQVKWALGLVTLFFIAEYVLLPDVASASKSISLLGHVNVAWMVLGVIL
jgi:hypothetical protein